MLLNTPRSSPADDVVCDLNDLHLYEHNVNINTRNYLLSKPSTLIPMSYHDLRLVITDQIPSDVVILPKSLSSSSQTLMKTPKPKRRNSENKKNHKQTGVDVYRSLVRSTSHYPVASERDTSNDNMALFSNSFTIDRIPLLPNTGSIHPHNLPKTQKYNNTNSNDKQRSTKKPLPSSPPDTRHRTTPTDQGNERMTGTTKSLSHMPKNPTRKQLHVYMPQTTCETTINFVT